MAQEARSRREAVREQAALWAVRLSDPSCDMAERAAFEAWRAADPAHEAAYERESVAWSELDRLRAFRPPEGEPDPDLFAPQRDAIAARPSSRHGRRPTPTRARAPFGRKAAAAAAAVALTLGTAGAFGVSAIATPAYATGLGERRVVVLEDGTRIELNTNSKVVVRYRKGVREVRLVRGEAMFQVANDPRAFVVQTPGGELKTANGELAVRLKDGGPAQVTVKSGHVTVEPEGGASAVALPPASAAVISASGAAVKTVTSDEIDRTLAWRQGAILLNGQSLAEAAAEFNRYNARQIVIADPSTAKLRLGGYFQTSDLPGFVKAVTGAFPVQADVAPGGGIRLSQTS